MALFRKSSQTSNLYQTIDARVGVDGDGNTIAPVTVTGDSNQITTTDHGAVAGGLQLAMAGIEGAYDTAREARASSDGLLSGALRMVGEQQQQFTGAIENIKTSDVRVLIIAGLAVVALVGFGAFARKGG